MTYAVVFSPGAVQEWKSLPANVRSKVRDAIRRHLQHEPTKVSRSRIKRLRGLSQPQYRLRVDEVRVFYDVEGERVEILSIISKAQAEEWLREKGIPDEKSTAGKD